MKTTSRLFAVALLAATVSSPAGAAPAASLKAFSSEMADIVEKVMPSVVVVRTEATRYRVAQDWFFGQVFKIPERLAGQGSGVVFSRDGYVLTNRHVIDGAQEIEVVFSNGEKYPAERVGDDRHTDIAVLRIRPETEREFPFVESGDSDALRVGEFVMALGSPFSLSSSVTLGIVSQKGRAIGALPSPLAFEDFIQTDAAVNRGNSGGPLVDLDGRLVGINTLIQTSGFSEGNIGISFAIPVNLAMQVAQSILKSGSWERPWIGISMTDAEDGVGVAAVVPQSPADKAGMRAGDIIRAVAGDGVGDPREVQRAILKRVVGEEVRLDIQRKGRSETIRLRTEPMPSPALLYQE